MSICVTYTMDDEGNPIECDDVSEWEKWLQIPSHKIIKRSIIDDILVSTVFLGTPYGCLPYLFFETMIFGGKHDQWQHRYTTKKDALIGHEMACEMVVDSIRKENEIQNS